jgi:hypothetical protein
MLKDFIYCQQLITPEEILEEFNKNSRGQFPGPFSDKITEDHFTIKFVKNNCNCLHHIEDFLNE